MYASSASVIHYWIKAFNELSIRSPYWCLVSLFFISLFLTVVGFVYREKYALLFDEPLPVQANCWYVAWARISGPSSDCGSSGQTTVTTEDQLVVFPFVTKTILGILLLNVNSHNDCNNDRL